MKKIYVVGNSVPIPDIVNTNKHNTSDSIVFVGKMDYDPNRIGVIWFVNKVFPLLKLDFPSLKFHIVGAKPTKEILKLKDIDGIDVTGYVESIEPYLKESSIVIAPMLTGAGIQNKIIQAMSYGCCVVTTDIGAEGIDISSNPICVINGEKEWLDEIGMLLKDKSLRISYGDKARKYVEKNLSQEKIKGQFFEFIDSINMEC